MHAGTRARPSGRVVDVQEKEKKETIQEEMAITTKIKECANLERHMADPLEASDTWESSKLL